MTSLTIVLPQVKYFLQKVFDLSAGVAFSVLYLTVRTCSGDESMVSLPFLFLRLMKAAHSRSCLLSDGKACMTERFALDIGSLG